ncbi:hypothetical protein [Lactobacillus crispatus]|jgi:hypothetical protein|uniref:Uncharacterized protein n=1 Tax=Lactobacillus crispatus TaxID=47770 RepID=A0AAW8WR10_9LACO|nr:hypothetical protein [Lactobacillus crispatus]STX18455.1 Uncharacterised protein [Lactobacillus acidophilus]MCT7696382.1 hypothetical protein [Lactobacillus crispatus]MCT7707842.1 hypothetical protein [Lactobacillus crispatus]MCT7731271.1 hypothetical protein [Lactobacillus crispatus]MCT7802800.1 hypothetical protein [Lactobacillus crispatus]
MTKRQRFRLAEYFGKPAQYYHATFDHITHKVNQQHKKIPVILLTDVYLVDCHDKKIRLANRDDFVDSNGRHIVADHLWVKLTKPWLELPQELLQGDEVYFQANVEQYHIVRADTINKRNQIWHAMLQKNKRIEQSWNYYTKHHYRRNFKQSLQKMRAKQQRNIDEAKQLQLRIKLVDYSLNRISKLHIASLKKAKYNFQRETYNYSRFKRQGYKYSAWLAARSMNYLENKHPEAKK